MSCVSAFLCLRKDKENSCLGVIRKIVVLTSSDIVKNLIKVDFDEKIILIVHVKEADVNLLMYVSVESLING